MQAEFLFSLKTKTKTTGNSFSQKELAYA